MTPIASFIDGLEGGPCTKWLESIADEVLAKRDFDADPAFGPSDPSHSSVSRPIGFNPGEGEA